MTAPRDTLLVEIPIAIPRRNGNQRTANTCAARLPERPKPKTKNVL
jgi:hypothetical protein